MPKKKFKISVNQAVKDYAKGGQDRMDRDWGAWPEPEDKKRLKNIAKRLKRAKAMAKKRKK